MQTFNNEAVQKYWDTQIWNAFSEKKGTMGPANVQAFKKYRSFHAIPTKPPETF